MGEKYEGNQAAGLKEQAMNLADDESMDKMGDMEQHQTAAKTEKPNLCQISEDDEEESFLLSLNEIIDKRVKDIQREQESESEHIDFLKIQVCLSNHERDEITKKYEAEVQKHSDSMRIIFNLQNALLAEKAQHRQDNEALEAKIKSLMAKADLKEQETKQMQSEHQSQLKKLKKDMVNIELTNENLLSSLNDTTHQLSLQREQWEEKCAALEKRHKGKVSENPSVTQAYQTSQRILENKYQAELDRNRRLLRQVEVLSNECTVMIESQQQLLRTRDYMMEECTLLEDICLTLKKKSRGPFGKKMQERNVELEKMKQKMRETLRTKMVSETETETETQMLIKRRDIDGPHRPAPHSARSRLRHLHN